MTKKETLLKNIGKFAQEKHINAIKNGMMAYVPFTIIAALGLLIANFPSETYTNFVTNIFGFKDASVWQNAVGSIMNGTMNLGTIITTLFISYNLCKEYKEKMEPINGAVISLCVYFLLIPWETVKSLDVVQTSYFGSQNLIVGIIVSMVVPEFYRFLMSKDKLKIKLPSEVPPMVADSFTSLIPTGIILVIFLILKWVLQATPYGNIGNLINTIIGQPLTALSGNIWGYLIALLITNLLWMLGIHGSSIIMSGVLAPFLFMMSDQNRVAAQAGKALPNVLTNEFFSYAGNLGFYICIACLIVCKNKETKALCKMAFLPATFGIHEPLVFGLPIMYNPIWLVPYVVYPIIGAGLTYMVQALGWVARLNGTGVPWTTPVGIYGFLASGGHISAAIWQIILGVIYTLLCIPFAKFYDKSKLKAEQEGGDYIA